MMENKMTKEQFLADLAANTDKLNKARLDCAQKLSELRDKYDEDIDSIQDDWAIKKQEIQSERHRIFQKYRDSGGILSGAEEGLLHPGWTKDKKGGVSDEEEKK